MGNQLHNRLSDFQTQYILREYDIHSISASQAADQLGVSKRRFFDYLKVYRENPEGFTLTYSRQSPKRLTEEAEGAIAAELRKEANLIADKDIPIRFYNSDPRPGSGRAGRRLRALRLQERHPAREAGARILPGTRPLPEGP